MKLSMIRPSLNLLYYDTQHNVLRSVLMEYGMADAVPYTDEVFNVLLGALTTANIRKLAAMDRKRKQALAK